MMITSTINNKDLNNENNKNNINTTINNTEY